MDGARGSHRRSSHATHRSPDPSAGRSSARRPVPASGEKNWFLRHKILTAVIALVLIGVVAASLGGGDDTGTTASADGSSTPAADEPSGDDSPTSDESSATKEPEPEKTKEPKPEPVTYGDGTYQVGKDIPRGTYRSSDDSQLCYWATLKGFGGELDDIIKNGNNSPAIVELNRGTKGFEAAGCGDWVAVEETFPQKPKTSFGDGTYVVGKHIEPGRYRADGKASELLLLGAVEELQRRSDRRDHHQRQLADHPGDPARRRRLRDLRLRHLEPVADRSVGPVLWTTIAWCVRHTGRGRTHQ